MSRVLAHDALLATALEIAETIAHADATVVPTALDLLGPAPTPPSRERPPPSAPPSGPGGKPIGPGSVE